MSDKPDYLFLMKGRKIFVATGKTYLHRDTFISWGWHWDRKRMAWIEDNGSEENEPCITAIQKLSGVKITIEQEETS